MIPTEVFNKLRFAILTIGIIGNIASFLVFSRKIFRKNSINVYFRALAVSDTAIIAFQFSSDFAYLFYQIDLFSSYRIFCKLSWYTYLAFSPISGWILVVFSFDKTINVLYPNRFDVFRKTFFQFMVVLIVFVVNGLAYVFLPISLEIFSLTTIANSSSNDHSNSSQTTTTTTYYCSLLNLSAIKEISIFYLIEACFVPFFLMIATSLVCIRELILSRRRVQVHEDRYLKARKAKDLKFSLNSIALNIIYVCLQTPICLSYLITIQDTLLSEFYLNWARVFYFLNFSISFFTYFICNSIFRQEAFKIAESIRQFVSQKI